MGYRRRLVCACVRTTLTDGTIDRIEGFATEGDAGRWIANESNPWLHTQRLKKEAAK